MAGRHKSTKRKPRGTGKPAPGKDRSAHKAARGKPLATLAQLSREFPSGEELSVFVDTLDGEKSDRTAAIMAASLVEHALYTCVCARLADAGDTVRHTWFEAPNAPFATFAAKIKLGRALGIYGPKMDDALCTIKDIRNVFAHRAGPITFEHPTMNAQVRSLAEAPMIGDTPAKTRYCAVCVKIGEHLVQDAMKHGGMELRLSFP